MVWVVYRKALHMKISNMQLKYTNPRTQTYESFTLWIPGIKRTKDLTLTEIDDFFFSLMKSRLNMKTSEEILGNTNLKGKKAAEEDCKRGQRNSERTRIPNYKNGDSFN